MATEAILDFPGLFTPTCRPFAAKEIIFKEVETPKGPATFTIDPWTRRWAVLQAPAVALLQRCNGRRTLGEIAEELAGDPSVPASAAPSEQIANELAQVGLLYGSQVEHRANGLPVYNRSEMTGFHIEITNACNMTCTHCYVSSGRPMPSEMTLEEILRTIDMLPPFSGKRIAISGGEPAVRKDCATIVEYCAIQCGHDVDLYTNGKRFPEALARRIVELNQMEKGRIRVQVSLEGANAHTSDLVRGIGSFDETMKSLEMFNSLGLTRDVVLFVCITKDNIGEIDALIKLAERLDVGMLVFSQWQRQGYAKDTPWASVAPSVEEWTAAGEKLLAYDNPRLTLFGNFHGDLNNNEYGRFSLDSPLFPKHLYFYNVFPRITPQGDVLADQLWIDPDWFLGNIRQDELDDCFETPKFAEQLARMRSRIDQVPECQACEWKNLCQCGSPGHTYAEYGHMNAKDLFCESRIYWFNRYVEHQVQKLYQE